MKLKTHNSIYILSISVFLFLINGNVSARKFLKYDYLLGVESDGECYKKYANFLNNVKERSEFDFIAHVLINEKITIEADTNKLSSNFLIKFIIKESFIGNKFNIVEVKTKINHPFNNIKTNEEWIIYGNLINGKLVMQDKSFCIREANGQKKWDDDTFLDPIDKIQISNKSRQIKDGKVLTKYKNNKIELEETYLNGKLTDSRIIYFPNGNLMFKGNYKDGLPDGIFETYYSNGQLKSLMHFDNGIKVKNEFEYEDTSHFYSNKNTGINYSQNCINVIRNYNNSGKLILEKKLDRNNILISEKTYDTSGNNLIDIHFNSEGYIENIIYPEANSLNNNCFNTENNEINEDDFFENNEAISAKKEIVVSVEKNNILYLGLSNPISIACPGINPRSIIIKPSEGVKISKNEGVNYYVDFVLDMEPKSTATIEIFHLNKNLDTIFLGSKSFFVRELPKPSIAFGNISEDGFIEKNRLLQAKFLFLISSVSSCGIGYRPTFFKVAFSIENKPDEIFENVNSKLSDAIISRIENVKKGERIVIYDVEGIGPAGSFKLPDRLVLMVK